MTPPGGQPCRVLSAELEEPMAGTAPHAVGWLVLEQPGPWGRTALTQSHLDPQVGAEIERACAAVDVRPALARRPGRRAASPRTVLLAHTTPGRSWLLTAGLDDATSVDWAGLAAAVAAGDTGDVRRLLPGAAECPPHLLVCANGRRDVCCAVAGRPVALAAASREPERVWESTHLGGHRFAPTAAVLPSGMVHGRLDGEAAVGILTAADRGEVVLASARGRTTWTAPAQAAELAVRRLLDEHSADALTVAPAEQVGAWVVRHVDGRAWQVLVDERAARGLRPESCGKDASPVRSWAAGVPAPLR